MHSILNGFLMGCRGLLLKSAYKSCAACDFTEQIAGLELAAASDPLDLMRRLNFSLEVQRATIYRQFVPFEERKIWLIGRLIYRPATSRVIWRLRTRSPPISAPED
jgi:hypothetical protein